MPRLDGVEAAVAMGALQPALAIAVHSSDSDALRRRADGLDLALFDKLHFDGLASWVADEVARRRASRPAPPRWVGRDLSCARCGYGVATNPPPLRCPMCASETEWVDAATGRAR
jgi:rubrerythrin